MENCFANRSKSVPCINEAINGKRRNSAGYGYNCRKTVIRSLNGLAVMEKTKRAAIPRQRNAALTMKRKVVRHG